MIAAVRGRILQRETCDWAMKAPTGRPSVLCRVAILDGTRRYIRDFADSVTAATRAREVVAAMQAKYPDHGNLTTLVFSAAAVMEAKG